MYGYWWVGSGRRYEVILKRSENWYEPEECMIGYTESTFRIQTRAAFFPWDNIERSRVILKAVTWMIDERLKDR